jgi:hypothetical protein
VTFFNQVFLSKFIVTPKCVRCPVRRICLAWTVLAFRETRCNASRLARIPRSLPWKLSPGVKRPNPRLRKNTWHFLLYFYDISLTLQNRVHYFPPTPEWRARTGDSRVMVHEGPDREKRYSSTLSLTSALDGDGWLTPRPSRFTPPPPRMTRYPLYTMLRWHQSRSGRVRNISSPSGLDPRTVTP